MKLPDDLLARADEHAALRRDLHAHPELGFQEERTSALVAERLRALDIEVVQGLGRTGVVGLIRRGTSPRMLALRADMDALPIQERNSFAHASRHPGRMHACGHDGHTATLLAAAEHLARHGRFDGTAVLVFQPAEEGGGGAREMISDGLFDRFPVEAIFGFHNWPGLPEGHFAVREGPVFASSNEFRITLEGKGSHAAMPHLGLDPVPAACQMVQAFQTIVTRNKRPLDTGVISVTMIHAGEATNVVPDRCVVEGTVRTFTTEVLDLIERRMRTIAESTATAFELGCDFEFHRNYPPTINHEDATAWLRGFMRETLGEARVHDFEPTMGAEDFSYFLQARPGAYFVIGNGEGQHRHAGHGLGPCMLHNPSYDFNDALIPIGAGFWVQLVERWLAPAQVSPLLASPASSSSA